MNRRRKRDQPEQLIPPAPPPAKPTKRAPAVDPNQAAKVYITKRSKPSVVPGHVKLTFTLDLPRELAERLSARAIREQRNIEAVIIRAVGGGRVNGTRRPPH